MNTLIIIGIIGIAFVIWIIIGINKDKKKYRDYALKNNLKYRRTDKDYLVYEILKTSVFYNIKDFKSKMIRKPYSISNILTKDDEIICTVSVNGSASGLLPDFLIYHNNMELPKLFIVSKTSSYINNNDINYYKNEFNELNIDLSTDKHIVIINNSDKKTLLPKVEEITPYLPAKYHFMIRNNKLMIYTFDKKINFQKFIDDCRKIKKILDN